MGEIGKYTLLTKLGSGGMADVHLATPERSPRREDLVALKVPNEHVVEDAELSAMFLDEARIAAQLNHPNIVRTIEVGQRGSAQYIAMEYLEGQTLSRIASALPDLPLRIHLAILLDVLRAIELAHDLKDPSGAPLNVVHRDLTPQNVFVTYDGITKILDFGIARAEGRSSRTRVGQLKGKVRYMSPEQASGLDLDRRTDLFAIGVMLFEACTRRRMWQEAKDLDVLRTLVARRHARSPQSVVPEVPDELDAICQRALSALEHRYQTASELRRDLERYAEQHVELPTREEIAAAIAPPFAKERALTKTWIEVTLDEIAAGRDLGVRPAHGHERTETISTVVEVDVADDEPRDAAALTFGTPRMVVLLLVVAMAASALTLVVQRLF